MESLEKTKTQDVVKPISSPSSSAAEVSEILKVMTESPPFKLLSPLGLELKNLLQKKEIPLAADGRDGDQKKRRMMNIL
jgi:ribose 5-phosphate isomerase